MIGAACACFVTIRDLKVETQHRERTVRSPAQGEGLAQARPKKIDSQTNKTMLAASHPERAYNFNRKQEKHENRLARPTRWLLKACRKIFSLTLFYKLQGIRRNEWKTTFRVAITRSYESGIMFGHEAVNRHRY